jgi:hypothetical protein
MLQEQRARVLAQLAEPGAALDTIEYKITTYGGSCGPADPLPKARRLSRWASAQFDRGDADGAGRLGRANGAVAQWGLGRRAFRSRGRATPRRFG